MTEAMNKIKMLRDKINEFPVDIWSNPNRPDDVPENCCEYCGRKLGKNPIYVHINTSGIILPNDVTESDLKLLNMQSQGGFALGSNCAKKLFGAKLSQYSSKELL